MGTRTESDTSSENDTVTSDNKQTESKPHRKGGVSAARQRYKKGKSWCSYLVTKNQNYFTKKWQSSACIIYFRAALLKLLRGHKDYCGISKSVC